MCSSDLLEQGDRMHDALDRRLWPKDVTELYFLLGCLNDLMGCLAADLGYAAAAEELARAGWAFAVVTGHQGLMAKLRLDLAALPDRPGYRGSVLARELAEQADTFS